MTGWYPAAPQDDEFVRMPKVDLHRHLEGSLRLETMLELARAGSIPLPEDGRLERLVQVQAGDPRTPANFLEKFKHQRPFYCSPAAIRRIAAEAVADAAADGVWLLELRFTPASLARTRGFSIPEVIDWVAGSVEQAGHAHGILTRLIVSVNRHDPLSLAETAAVAAAARRSGGVVALDLAGDESISARPFLGLFREARQSGLQVCIHAGEWGGPENVREALEDFRAARIGHGVRIMEDPRLATLAREWATPFEVCLTSNVQSGVAAAPEAHPLPAMLSAGLNVTLNSDDPGIQRTRLSDEYRVACRALGLSRLALQERILAAAQASFLEEDGRRQLAARLRRAFAQENFSALSGKFPDNL